MEEKKNQRFTDNLEVSTLKPQSINRCVSIKMYERKTTYPETEIFKLESNPSRDIHWPALNI